MHGGTRLGHDDRHSLVHKNHFEQDTEGLSGMAENDAGLDWLVQGSFGLSRESMGALPGQRIRKENCESCVELEQMLAKGKSKTMREGAYKRYMKLGNEALRKHRESQNLDLVVAKKMEKLAALQVCAIILSPITICSGPYRMHRTRPHRMHRTGPHRMHRTNKTSCLPFGDFASFALDSTPSLITPLATAIRQCYPPSCQS